MKPDPRTDVICRLRNAVGHLNAVIEMAEDDQPCEQVLRQLRAVGAALHMAGGRLIISQIEQSQAIILANPTPTQSATELKRLISLYSILLHGPNRHLEVSK